MLYTSLIATFTFMTSLIENVKNLDPDTSLNWQDKLKQEIDYLINNDFSKLVQILYSIDVSEAKLKTVLNTDKNTDAAYIILQQIIDRLAEKKRQKALFPKLPPPDEDEKW